MSDSPRAGCLPRIGGALALDFANTTTGRGTAAFVEHLFDYADVLRWAAFNDLLSGPEAGALLERLGPAGQARAFAAAMDARALLNRVFDPLARGGRPASQDLARLAGLVRAGWAGAELVPAGPGFAWRFPAPASGDQALLGAVLRSAASLLTEADLARLKVCPGPDCGWVFLDASKNGSRVWCEMEVCGTRAKLRRRTASRRARVV